MTIDEFINYKISIENHIKEEINDIFDKFEEVTGIRPTEINFDMIDITNLEDISRKIIIENVKLNIEL